jgi:vanillate monooxygenase ferredoxin subunit
VNYQEDMTTTPSLTVRVERKTREATDILGFDLVGIDGEMLPAFSAGSHIDLMLPNGITRQYSLCNPPTERRRYSIAVLREPASRGGSKALHDAVHEGDTLVISPPRNHFALAHGAKRHLLLAGGIGITPILCMADRLAATGEHFDLHYCARSEERMAFRERVQAFSERATLHLDDGDAVQRLDFASLLAQPEPGTHLYVCGPKGFMDAVLEAARHSSWKEECLHYEFFSGAAINTDSDSEFDVRLASTGQVIAVARGTSVTEALLCAGIKVNTSCEQGVCGSCLTRVLEGTPDHRDLYLTPDEQQKNDQFTPCCSRSKSKVLVLDL